ncbi:putative two-component system sensor kinase [Alloactinosynnema sp. L-07]|uniref:sensor histidine kinase n=1 Tax=Alloactinosynnema sp. L-07 TaxID=1653480 RepID=UPI00065EF825|nr:sensor histidine kinase [Alloactinosynnema sp. L-07]CRK61921.1 putative two-component system sensor kinase [Alloactinosynnema sp. L-07]
MSDRQYPHPAAAVAYLLGAFPLSLVTFITTVTFMCVGVGTVVIWVGVALLVAAAALTRVFGNAHRFWARTLTGADLPPRPVLSNPDEPVLRQWKTLLTDRRTWRDFTYLMLEFPLSIIGFALGVASIPLVPLALWVAPRYAWLHSQLAIAMLGPDRTADLTAKAERLQASRARGVDAAEAERRRIERDLHDGAQQRLVAVAMGLGRAKGKLDADPELARTLIDEAHADAKLAVAELRDLARGIYPAVLGDRGLDAALSSLAAKCPVPVEVTVTVEPRPPAAVESTAYFIVGECLTNIAKHAQAEYASVRVWRETRSMGDEVVVEITDNGIGGADVRPGGGLSGLADRAATIDGVMTVVSPLGGPTVIRADLPCVW